MLKARGFKSRKGVIKEFGGSYKGTHYEKIFISYSEREMQTFAVISF